MKKLILVAVAAASLALTAAAAEAGGSVSKETYSRICRNGVCTVKHFEARNGHIIDQVVDHDRDGRRYDGGRHGDWRFGSDRRDNDHWDNRRHQNFPWAHDRGYHYGQYGQDRSWHGATPDRSSYARRGDRDHE
jgi:opacity protein-like surface antigen